MRPQISYPHYSTWTELDNILSGKAFVDLNRLDERLHLVYTASNQENGNFCCMHGLELLPQVASNPSIECRLEMRTIDPVGHARVPLSFSVKIPTPTKTNQGILAYIRLGYHGRKDEYKYTWTTQTGNSPKSWHP